MMARTCTATATVLLALALSAAAQDQSKWIKYESPEGRYSVLMPVMPSLGTKTPVAPDGKAYVQYSSAANEGSSRWIVGYFDHPKSTRFSTTEARDGIIDVLKGKLLSDESTKIEGHKVRTLRILASTNGISIIILARFYLVGSRVYILQAIFPKDQEGLLFETKAQAFFNSFQAKPNER